MATNERVTLRSQPPLTKINVLVVDDDSTSLTIVSAMLKSWKHEVVTVKSPLDALSTLRLRQSIDLVVTDLHMPEMNGVKLQKQIKLEFNIPVIIMSSDEKESVIVKSLAGGAVFYLVKPVKQYDLKNVWQHAVAARKGKSPIAILGPIGCNMMSEKKKRFGTSSAGKFITYHDQEVNSTSSSVNEEKKTKKRKYTKNSKEDLENECHHTPKKAKIVWTQALHDRFLEAIKHYGLEKAVPKKILEFMNVSDLTREKVASHLQKYRIFLKKIAETVGSSKGFSNRTLRSTFATGHTMLQSQQQAQMYNQHVDRRSAFRTGLRGTTTSVFSNNINGASRGNSSTYPRLGYGQTTLLTNNQPLLGGSNTMSKVPYHRNLGGYGLYGANFSVNNNNGNSFTGVMNAPNSLRVYQQQAQPHPSGAVSLLPSFNTLASNGNVNNSRIIMSSGYPNNSNYVGLHLAGDWKKIGMGIGTTYNNGIEPVYNAVPLVQVPNNGINNGMTPTINEGAADLGYNVVQAEGGSSSSLGLMNANNGDGSMGVDTINQQQRFSGSALQPSTGGGNLSPKDTLFEFPTLEFPSEQQIGSDPLFNDVGSFSFSYDAAMDHTLNQIMDIEITSLNEDNEFSWNDQSLKNLVVDGEDLEYPNLGDTEPVANDHCFIFDETTTDKQPNDNGVPIANYTDTSQNYESLMNSELHKYLLVDY